MMPPKFAEDLENASPVEPDQYEVVYTSFRPHIGSDGVEYRGRIWKIGNDHYAPGFVAGASAKLFTDYTQETWEDMQRDASLIAGWAAELSRQETST